MIQVVMNLIAFGIYFSLKLNSAKKLIIFCGVYLMFLNIAKIWDLTWDHNFLLLNRGQTPIRRCENLSVMLICSLIIYQMLNVIFEV
jgi:hypothetical protein